LRNRGTSGTASSSGSVSNRDGLAISAHPFKCQGVNSKASFAEIAQVGQ
jgi:hypothetical protein